MAKMRRVTLTRIGEESGDQGTFGTFVTDRMLQLYSGEMPWRNNTPEHSCIPTGTYTCKVMPSQKHGACYYVLNVPNRMDIEIHKGNFCGDTTKGYKSDVLGCIVLGRAIGELETALGPKQRAIISSADAMKAFELDLVGADFELTVK